MKRTAKGTVFALLLLCAVSWCTADDLLGLTLKPEVPIAVPDLVGRSEERAAEYDWIAAVSSYRYDSAPAGTVLAQNPVAGSLRKPSGRGTVTVRQSRPCAGGDSRSFRRGRARGGGNFARLGACG